MIRRTLLALLVVALAAGAARTARADSLTVKVFATVDGGKEVPAAGARVLVRPAGEVIDAERDLPVSPLVVGKDGSVVAERPAGEVVVAAGLALRGTVLARVGPGGSEVRIVLPPEAQITGSVVGPDGKPVAAAEVLAAAERPDDTGTFPAPGSLLFRVLSGAEGTFTIYRLAPGESYRLRVRAPGLAPAEIRDFAPGGAPVRVRLTPGAIVRGLVISRPGGEPVAKAVVSIGGAEGATGADGRFEVRGVPPGTWRIVVRAAGYVYTGDEELTLADGDLRVGRVIRVFGTGRLRGRVLTPATRPAAGAELYLRYPPDPDLVERLPPDRLIHAGTADADGRFDLVGLLPAHGVDLIARCEGYAPAVYLGYSIVPARTIRTVILLRTGGLITGKVVDGEGGAVAGARVYALDDRLDLSGLVTGGVPASPTAVETKTGEDGAFALEHVPGGRRALVAVKEGLIPAVLRGVDIADRSERKGLLLTAGEGADLAGKVLGPDGKPVAGAEVTASSAFGAARSARTGNDGTFRLSGLPAGPYALHVTAPGCAPLDLSAVRAPSVDLTLPLLRAVGLTGSVLRQESSDKVGPARVRALVREAPSSLAPERILYRTVREVRTPDGEFALPDLPPGVYRVEAWTAAGDYGYVDGLRVRAGERVAPLEIHTFAGQAIHGRVLSGVDGQPVEGATVAVRGPGDTPGALVITTGADGVFDLAGVPPGFHDLVVTGRDLAPVTVSSVEVRPAADTRIDDVILPEGAVVRGVVTGDDGQPRVGAKVRMTSAELGGTRRAATDEQGQFRFEHVATGSWLVETEDALAGPGGRQRQRLLDVPEQGEVFVRLGSGRGTSLTGRVTASGLPVGHAAIRLLRISDRPGTDRQVLSTTTDADGNYLFADVRPGNLWLLVTPPGQSAAATRESLDLLPGAVTIHDVYLPDSGVEGRVENLDTGEDLPGATLLLTKTAPGAEGTFLSRLTREVGETTSGPDGAFRFDGVAPGDYRLEAYREGFGQTVATDVRVLPGGYTPTRVAMPPAGRLVGHVIDDDGRPVTSARVSFLDARGTQATRESGLAVDSTGSFRIDTLRTGTYTVEAVAPGFARASVRNVEVFPGSVPELEIRLKPEGRLLVSVFGAGGRPVAGARIAVRDFWGRAVEIPRPPASLLAPYRDPTISGSDGTVLLSHLPPGVYDVQATKRGLSGPSVKVRVLDGELARGAVVLLPPAPEKE